jgi:hypothetical protein
LIASRPVRLSGKGFPTRPPETACAIAPPFRCDAEFSGDFAILKSIGRAKDDTRTLDQASRKRPRARQLFQGRPILWTQI